jgi:glycosyltransferase involved in cell wall biosynthesis
MCATPIIVNKETTMADLVEEENCGVVVPYFDIDALKAALNRLRNDPSLGVRLGKNGRLAFENKYNWQVMENRLINLYNELNG